MKELIILLILGATVSACISKYDFNVEDNTNAYIVEAVISDKSFTDSYNYPSEGRYFTVKLSKSSEVDNVRDELVSNATVQLVNNKDQLWSYTETEEGVYALLDKDFKAEHNVTYQLKIYTPNGDTIESVFEELPNPNASEINNLIIEEAEQSSYEYTNIGRTVVKDEGINLKIKLENEDQRYFKYNATPTFTYFATFATVGSPIKKCWVNWPRYFENPTLAKNNINGAIANLTFLKVVKNELLDDYFSILLVQEGLSKEHYQYWADLQAQKEKGGLYDNPPFNLITNLSCSTAPVQGYFGVNNETATRWEFNREAVSYLVPTNYQQYLCETVGPDPVFPGQCDNCTLFNFGTSRNYPPHWLQ